MIKAQKTSKQDVSAHSAITMADLLALEEKPLITIKRRQVVEATVLKIAPNEIILDLGSKAEGMIAGRETNSEAGKNLKVGDTIPVSIIDNESDNSYIICSLKTFTDTKKYSQIQDALEAEGTIEVKVVEERKGGFLVHYNAIRGFLPLSQVAIDYIGKPKELLGKDIIVKVLEFDRETPRLIVSQKAVVSSEQNEKREVFFTKTKIGNEVTGTVVAVLPFGIVVDLQGVEGFIHISEIAWERVDNPSNYYHVGDALTGLVLNIDQVEGKVLLSVKQLTESPWAKVSEQFAVNQTVDGIVTKNTPYGVLVRLDDGIIGLIAKTKLGGKTFSEDDQVTCIIEVIDAEHKKINLGLVEGK